MSLTSEELGRFAADLAGSQHLWRHLVRHARDMRVHEQIWDDEHVNAWLICWSEDQDTGFHDHDRSEAAFTVLDGQVKEERLRVGGAPVTRVAGPGSTLTVPAVAIHRVLHTGERPAVTIHAYSPPLERTGAYRIGPDGELERASVSYEEELQAEAALV
ncbi:MAG TPA: cysteine dioxygenase family protein [Solirubrobacteraceae bacterium]